jgi:hypothetical protein
MPEYIDTPEYAELTTDQETDTGLVRSLRKMIRDAGSAHKKLLEEYQKVVSQNRSTSLRELLDERKVKNASKVAALAAKFDVEPTKEAVDAWLSEYGDVFGVTQDPGEGNTATTEGSQPSAAQNAQTSTVPSDQQTAWSQIQAAEQAGQVNAPVGADRIRTEIQSLASKGLSFEDTVKALSGLAPQQPN